MNAIPPPIRWMVVLALLLLSLAACGGRVQQNLNDRNEVLDVHEKTVYAEAQQINAIETWKDQPNKIIYWYWINMDGTLRQSWICRGIPVWSTESLEPNSGAPYSTNNSTFVVPDGNPIDPYDDIRTNELAGKDGTFGEPGAERVCMTVEGFPIGTSSPYNDWSPVPLVYPRAEVTRDLASEGLLIAAQGIVDRGGCIDPIALGNGEVKEIACKQSVVVEPVQTGQEAPSDAVGPEPTELGR